MVPGQQQTWPEEIDPSEFRIICRELIDAVADYHADLSGRGSLPSVTPAEVQHLLAKDLCWEGESSAALLANLTEIDGMRELFSKIRNVGGYLHGLVRDHPDFEVLHDPGPYSYCFRYVPNGLADRQDEPSVQALLDRLNQRIVEAVQRSGHILLMTTRIRARIAIRMSICSHRTLEEDIDATFEAVARWGRLLSQDLSTHYENPPETEALPCSNESCSSPTEVSAT